MNVLPETLSENVHHCPFSITTSFSLYVPPVQNSYNNYFFTQLLP